jgi:hypothetical protein
MKRQRAETTSSKRRSKAEEKRPVINVNITNKTINNYFAPAQPNPQPAPEPEEDTCLFPKGERQNNGSVKYHGHTRSYRISHVSRDNKLMAGCTVCINNYQPMRKFAPPKSNKNFRRLPDFNQANADFKAAVERRDLPAAQEARERVEKTRNSACVKCQHPIGYLSPAERECKEWWEAKKEEMCALFGGCQNPACRERGPQAACVLEGDHVHGKDHPDPALRKTEALSAYKYWACNGGVPAMERELAKGFNWFCGFCHALQPTCTAANRCADPATMPDGRQGKNATEEEKAQYNAKHSAKIRFPKQQYVDERKRAIGCCAHCGRDDVAGKEWAFHFDHIDETQKLKGKDTLAGETGGVAGLVNNNVKRAALDALGVREAIDWQIDVSQLLCHNCHHRKTNGYPRRVD